MLSLELVLNKKYVCKIYYLISAQLLAYVLYMDYQEREEKEKINKILGYKGVKIDVCEEIF